MRRRPMPNQSKPVSRRLVFAAVAFACVSFGLTGASADVLPVTYTINYYNSLMARYGTAATQAFSRLYLVPNMGHCSGGPATDQFDFLTPRHLHETLRVEIPNSSLVIIPRAYHAFTLEKGVLTADLLARFADDVLAGRWQGNQAVWIAPEEAGGELTPFPAGYDHLRAIPVRAAPP